MNLLKKAKGVTKKCGTLIKSPENLDALFSGVYHYKNRNETIENLKDERAKICGSCELNVEDDFEKIEDEDQRISGKMCEKCFCSLPYLLRQTKKGCELNKW